MSDKRITEKRLPILIIIASLAAFFSVSRWGIQLDNIFYDTLENNVGPSISADDIVVVGIDEPSFQQLQLQWPWPRSIHAQLLEQLSEQGAKVVAFDLLFPEQSNQLHDELFAAAIAETVPVVVGTDLKKIIRPEYTIKTPIPPIEMITEAGAVVGHVSIPTDKDSFVRRVQPQIEKTPSLAYAAVQLFKTGYCCEFDNVLDEILIDFTGGLNAIKQVSYHQALNADTDLPDDIFNNKIVFVGVTSISASLPDRQHTDHYATPLTRTESGYTAGVLIHAFIAGSLLGNSWNVMVPRLPTAILGLGLAVLFARFGLGKELTQTVVRGVMIIAVLITLCIYLFIENHFYVSLVTILLPIFMVMMISPYHNYLIERRRKQEIRRAFSSYVNESIVQQIERDPEALKLGGKQVEGSVLFMDMVGFSTLTEQESPETMITFINEFLSSMIEIGMDEGGTVERFLGDAIMLIWGAPVAQQDHAERACNAALRMQVRILEIAAHTKAKYGFDVGARIGINSGAMTAGNIGGKDRFAYTVLGDCVNLAARFEAASKKYGSTVIVGKSTLEELAVQRVANHFDYRLMDFTRVKGREQPEELFELVNDNRLNPPNTAQLQAREIYGLGLDLLLNNQPLLAQEKFTQAAQIAPLSGVDRMLERCAKLIEKPLAKNEKVIFDISS